MSNPSIVDLLVKPLVEYVRAVENATGHRPKIEVTVDVPVFLELAQWPMVRPGGDPLAPITIYDDITIRPPGPDFASMRTTLTYRELDDKTTHTATLDPSGRMTIDDLIDEERSDG